MDDLRVGDVVEVIHDLEDDGHTHRSKESLAHWQRQPWVITDIVTARDRPYTLNNDRGEAFAKELRRVYRRRNSVNHNRNT